jgi:hypothetical protein
MVLTTPDIWGHVGYAFLGLGMYLLAIKSIWGWVSRFVGEIIWLIIGYVIGMTSMYIWGVFFLGMELYGLHSWWDKKKAPRRRGPCNFRELMS